MRNAGMDRLAALHTAIALVRRGGTISLSGVYGGAADAINMMVLFDKQIQLRIGQANVKRWVPDTIRWVSTRSPRTNCRWRPRRKPKRAARRRTTAW
jgi:threonine dehydrogenase-like Zn-dependent dehydrogenase